MKNYEKVYKEALERAKKLYNEAKAHEYIQDMEDYEMIFPELKESEDERIRKEISDFLKTNNAWNKEWIAWLEKQCTPAKLSEEEQNSFAKGVLSSCALSFINYLDAHSYEGKMCVSNGECEDIENAFHNAMWDRLHRYYCKYIEKQGKQKITWSEEDESTLNELIIGFHAYKDLYPNFWKLRTDEIIEWLKKKKDEHTTDNG